MDLWLSGYVESRETETLCRPSAILRGTEPVSALIHAASRGARFNIAAALSILFLSRILPVAISPLVLALKSLNLNIKIRHKLPLF